MSEEYIEREAVIKMLEKTDWYTISKNRKLMLGAANEETALYKAGDMFQLVRKAPAADVEPVRHGKWIKKRRGTKSPEGYYYWNTPLTRIFVCSECGRQENKREPYCHCGAKMDKEE